MRKGNLKKRRGKSNLALLLAASLALSGGAGLNLYQMECLAAPEAVEETTQIHTAEEFLRFAQNCALETYSKGKTFVLEADLNLLGTEFEPIGVFAGTFDGGGHKITGLTIEGTGSSLGLFRYVQEGAAVKNLNVQGRISPRGSRTNIGGIAGTNRGRIEHCVFSGQIMAQEALGGIAGYNEETGVITGCENQASLTGNLKTGGIAGWNEGLITECVNRGDVNATNEGVSEDTENQYVLGNIDLEERIQVERVNDAGGIAGLSSGTIQGSANYGAVGYPHIGYNLGGIAGRQNGLTEGCANYARVQGRKDVGGIVGQFEPYLTVSYEEDMFGSLEGQMDALSDMGDSLSRLLEETGDTASMDLDQVDDQLVRIKEIGRSYKELYRDEGDLLSEDAGNSLDKIEFILDHMDVVVVDKDTKRHIGSAKRTAQEIGELRKQLKTGYEGDLRDIQALKQWLQERLRKIQRLIQCGQDLQTDLLYLIAHAPQDAADGVEDFGAELEELFQEVSTLIDTCRFHGDQIQEDLDQMDEELTSELDVLSDDMHLFTNNLKDQKAKLREQKNQIQNQIDQMRNTISDGVDRAREEKELFEDISDLESGKVLGDGMVSGCTNQGAVSADFQAGGIVGIIGMETSLDPEQDLEADTERTLNVSRNIKAIVFQCANQETVTVKNDYAGGIVGKANLGALIQNQNYGDIIVEDGNYAGGITGSSAYVLRRNYNMCNVDGNDYAGGIAGWGTDILDNYSMVSFGNPDGQWIGSIAGSADPEGTIEGNYYVEQGIGALDGITYDGQAKGLPYEHFRSLEQMPEAFGQLSVSFLVENQVIKTILCNYGSAVPQSAFPLLPKKDGYYYQWEEKDLSYVTGNEKVHAIYKPWNTTIASSEDKMPLLLAEANFYPGTVLTVEEGTGEGLMLPEAYQEGYKIVKAYQYSITQPEQVPMPDQITVHVLADGHQKGSLIGIAENGGIRMADQRWDGNYLVFEANGPGEFVILEPERNLAIWLVLAGVAGAAIIIWILVSKKGGGSKKKPENGNAESDQKHKRPKKAAEESQETNQEAAEKEETNQVVARKEETNQAVAKEETNAGKTKDVGVQKEPESMEGAGNDDKEAGEPVEGNRRR